MGRRNLDIGLLLFTVLQLIRSFGFRHQSSQEVPAWLHLNHPKEGSRCPAATEAGPCKGTLMSQVHVLSSTRSKRVPEITPAFSLSLRKVQNSCDNCSVALSHLSYLGSCGGWANTARIWRKDCKTLSFIIDSVNYSLRSLCKHVAPTCAVLPATLAQIRAKMVGVSTQ